MSPGQSDRIESKLDVLIANQQQHAVLLERHTVLHEKNSEDLAEHIRRTEILEKQMDVALIPIQFGRATAWIIGLLASITAAVAAFR